MTERKLAMEIRELDGCDYTIDELKGMVQGLEAIVRQRVKERNEALAEVERLKAESLRLWAAVERAENHLSPSEGVEHRVGDDD